MRVDAFGRELFMMYTIYLIFILWNNESDFNTYIPYYKTFIPRSCRSQSNVVRSNPRRKHCENGDCVGSVDQAPAWPCSAPPSLSYDFFSRGPSDRPTEETGKVVSTFLLPWL